MTSAQILDIEALLVPIAGAHPAGQDLLHDGVYDAIRKARQEGRDGDSLEPSVRTADWGAVIAQASAALQTRSKDLQLAVWLAEALAKRHGFPGLRDGLRLLGSLQQHFWPSLYPTAEHGDLEDRIRVLEWFNRELPLSIRHIPLTQTRDGKAYSWSRWEESRLVDNLERQNQAAHEAALADGKLTGEQFDAAVADTPRAYYDALAAALGETLEAYTTLDRVLDEKFGREAPTPLGIRKALEDCAALVERILKQKRALEPEAPPEPAAPGEAGEADAVTPPSARSAGAASFPTGSASLAPRDRAEALRRLAAVAQFFRQTEPHSPVAYLIERAMRWGEMPLERWLQEVISNDDVLSRVRETLGLRSPDDHSDH